MTREEAKEEGQKSSQQNNATLKKNNELDRAQDGEAPSQPFGSNQKLTKDQEKLEKYSKDPNMKLKPSCYYDPRNHQYKLLVSLFMNDKKKELILGFSLNDKDRKNNVFESKVAEYVCRICGRKKGEYDPREAEFDDADRKKQSLNNKDNKKGNEDGKRGNESLK